MPTAISTEEVGESTRDSALPWDRIRPVDFGRETALTQAVAALTQAHERRIEIDPDFRSLLADLESFDRVRTQKQLSLNLQTRIAERERLEKERLGRENQRRAARGEAPVGKLSDLEDTDPPDAVLAEAAEIAADLSRMQDVYLSRVKAEALRSEARETATP